MSRYLISILPFLLGFFVGGLVFGEWFDDEDHDDIALDESYRQPPKVSPEPQAVIPSNAFPRSAPEASSGEPVKTKAPVAATPDIAPEKEEQIPESIHQELNRLRAQNAYLKDRLEESEDFRRAAENEPIEPPEDLQERFTQEPLRHAIGDALKETGFSGEVNLVDCQEYPCIVSGKLSTQDLENPEAFNLLFNTDALQAYGKDRRQISVNEVEFVDQDGETRKEAVFSISFYEELEGTRQAAIHDRVIQRERKIVEALFGR